MSAQRSRSEEQPHVALVIGALHGVSGGAERVLVDVANGLHRRGHPVTVITYQDRNGPSFYPLDFGIRRLDGRRRHARRRKAAPLRSLRSATTRRPLVAAAVWAVTYIPRIVAFRRMLRLARPDVAVGFMPSTFPYLVGASWITRTRSIASIHNVPFRELGGDPQRWDQNLVDVWFRNFSLRRADAVTVLLPSFVDQIEESVRPKTYVVPNMIAPHEGAPASVETEAVDNTILAVGRLSPAKDHETLIRAWAELEDRFPDWRVQIYGEGPLLQELEELIEELGLSRVTIEEPTSEISAVYASSKFVVMSSTHEGFGLVTAEAMAHGLPVIGFSDCEGTNEIVLDGENGLLVEPGDDRAGALATAMTSMIDDEARRVELARHAPATTKRYDPDVVLDIWEQMIDEVVGR